MDAFVVELSRFMRNVLSSMLQEAGISVAAFPSGAEALERLRHGRIPDLIWTDQVTADITGVGLKRAVAACPAWSTVSMVLITGSTSATIEREAFLAGFAAVFRKNEIQALRVWLRNFVSMKRKDDPISGRILHVADSASEIASLRQILDGRPVEIDCAAGVEDALIRLESANYDIIVADYDLPGDRTALDLVRTVREGRPGRIPVLVLSRLEDSERKVGILESGADDFVAKPVVPRELVARLSALLQNKHLIDRLETQQQLLYELAMRDQLTSLFNRHSLFEIAPKEISTALRNHYEESLLVIDVDNFKAINDRYGHQTGDLVLRELGALILSLLRDGDYAARFGGEEFVVLMPHCGIQNAMHRAEELRAAAEALHPSDLEVTISIGVAALREGWDFEVLFKAADRAVYRAKDGGKNRVAVEDRDRALVD